MGSWGAGIRDDDFVCDVENAFKEHLKDGMSLVDATKSVREQFSDALDDSDEGPLFWIAIADMQWTYGDLDPLVLQRVQKIIETANGMERWGEPTEKLYKQRTAALSKFNDKISLPNPKPSRRPKRINRKPKFSAGDCLSIVLENGQYGAALVLATDSSDPENPTDLVAQLDYLSDAPPRTEVFTKRNWLKLTHHNWKGKLEICWYHATGFRKMKPRLTIIGNTPILETDPKQSASYASWHLLGEQVICQHEWDAGQNA